MKKEINNILLIGGSGFIGSHVADQLSNAGHSVTIFDQQASSWLRDDQKMIVGDLLDFELIDNAVSSSDIVYNFAAISDLNVALNNPLDTVRVNLLGNTHVLEACRKYNIDRFVYASTVYVNSRDGGFYRCSKQSSELFVEEYQRTYGLDFTILRYGSVYGPRSDKHNGMYRIVRDALMSNHLRYEGHPESMREYIHVEDVAAASVSILDESFKNQSIILTGQEPMRVYDLLQMLAEIMGITDNVEFDDGEYEGHYIRTPYSYQPKLGRKFIPPLHVDLGQGLLQLIEEVQQELEKQ
jgi:UDP-glucose 4-epimerase